MLNSRILPAVVVFLASSLSGRAQDQESTSEFETAAAEMQARLEKSLTELQQLRDQIAEEKIPMNRDLNELEAELTRVRLEYQETTRLLDSRTLDLTNLGNEIKSRQDEKNYLSNLLGEYIRSFESRIHITEKQRYDSQLEEAKLAPENTSLSESEVYATQAKLLDLSLERLEDALGGTRFPGTAVDPSGLVNQGDFVLLGPAAVFRSADGKEVGTAEQRLGSLEPAGIGFADPDDAKAAEALVHSGQGLFPLDPTLGSAHKIDATDTSVVAEFHKGGTVMYPISIMAGLALLVALFKWLGLAFLRKPSKKRLRTFLNSIKSNDENEVREKLKSVPGPVGKMLAVGVEHLNEPKELIEEVMFETLLTTRLRLQRWLPFIAICAASAPLLGLLGTVTGIINTFKLITVFGSGDVKTLSGGISEALITTKYGLIVAIPSLLLHAFLSRKARGIVSQMEGAAIAFVNQVSMSVFARPVGMSLANSGRSEAGIPAREFASEEDPMVKSRTEARLAESIQELQILRRQIEDLGREQERYHRMVDVRSDEIASLEAKIKNRSGDSQTSTASTDS